MTTAEPRHIAIVEDEFPTAQLLRDIVEGIGHRVGDALYYQPPNADDGFWRDPPDLVLCDVYFSGEPTGVRFCQRLAERAIPFFLVSAGDPADLLPLLGGLRPLGLIHKPLRPKEVFSRIELAFIRKHAAGGPPTPEPSLSLRDRGLKVSVPLREVAYVESDRNNCIVHAGGGVTSSWRASAASPRSTPPSPWSASTAPTSCTSTIYAGTTPAK